MLRWYESDLGQYVLARELAWFDAVSSDLFGFHAMQMGECDSDFLRANRMPHRFCAGLDNGPLRSLPELLPIASQSLDLLGLAACSRIFVASASGLARGGTGLATGRALADQRFQSDEFVGPASLHCRTFFESHAGSHPWHGRFIHLTRIKDWLALMGFELVGGRMACYAPPWIAPPGCPVSVFSKRREIAGGHWAAAFI
jgi:hypothetical protein